MARLAAGTRASSGESTALVGAGLGLILCIAVVTLGPISLLAALGAAVCLAVAFLRPKGGLLFWLVTTPLFSLWAGIRLGAGVPDLTYDRLFIGTILGILVVRMILGVTRPVRPGPIEWAMAAFTVITAASLVWSSSTTTDLQLLLDAYITPFLVYWIARNLFAADAAPRGLIGSLIGLAAFLAVLGFLQMTLGRVPLTPGQFNPIHEGRMTGPFVNAAEFGGVMAMIGCFTIAFSAVFRKGGRWILGIVASVCFAAAAASLTRAVWVGAVTGIAIIVWNSRAARRLALSLGVLAVIAGVLLLPMVMEPDSFVERGTHLDPIYSRLISTTTALRMWASSPVMGFGFGRYVYYWNSRAFLSSFGSISAGHGHAVDVPHNEFLHILVLTGGIGFLCYLGIFHGAWRAVRAGRRAREPGTRCAALGLGAAMAVYVVIGLFTDLLFMIFLTTLFYFLLGALGGLLDSEAPRPRRGRP